jgi:hypothetical protein
MIRKISRDELLRKRLQAGKSRPRRNYIHLEYLDSYKERSGRASEVDGRHQAIASNSVSLASTRNSILGRNDTRLHVQVSDMHESACAMESEKTMSEQGKYNTINRQKLLATKLRPDMFFDWEQRRLVD